MAENRQKFYEDQKVQVRDSELLEGETKERYEKALRKWDSKLERLTQANRASERLGKEDFEIRINTRD